MGSCLIQTWLDQGAWFDRMDSYWARKESCADSASLPLGCFRCRKWCLNHFSATIVELHNLMIIKLVYVQCGGIVPVHVKPTACDFTIEFFKWKIQHLRIKLFYGHSENAAKTERSGLQCPFCGDCQYTTEFGLQPRQNFTDIVPVSVWESPLYQLLNKNNYTSVPDRT